MRKTSMLVLSAILLMAMFSGVELKAQVPAKFFGMHHDLKTFPLVPYGSLRLWDTGNNWDYFCSGPSTCNFARLDNWLNAAQSHGITEILYTFGHTPQWASTHPYDTSCAFKAGTCWPPKDLNADGTGTDQMWKNYVSLIAHHAGTRIQYWEIWNEAHNAYYWSGTFPQMVRMAKDARAIILSVNPNAKILAPSSWPKWLASYLAAGGGPTFDIGNIHPYPGSNPPEVVASMIRNYRSTLAAHGLGSRPIWATEASWGKNSNAPNTANRPGEVARFYLMAWTGGAVRFHWYKYNSTSWGTLYNGGLLTTGVAYHQVENWMVGATMTSACAGNSAHTYKCTLSRNSGSYQAQVVWNTAGTVNYTAPSQYRQYRTLTGAKYAVPSNGVVKIGPNPIILETGASGNTM